MSEPIRREELGDWQRFPPKSEWDTKRRSILAFISDAERELARLRSQVAEHPHDNPPDVYKALKMMEHARPASRYANDCDTILQEVVDAHMETNLADTSQVLSKILPGEIVVIRGEKYCRTRHAIWVLRLADDPRFRGGKKPVWVQHSLVDPQPEE